MKKSTGTDIGIPAGFTSFNLYQRRAVAQHHAKTAGAMRIADGFESGPVIDPLIDTKAVEKVEAHIATG
jgi:hypothetical protein